MQIGLIGLGAMGAGMAARLKKAGHDVVGCDRDPAARGRAAASCTRVVENLPELFDSVAAPRVLWLMVPPREATSAVLDGIGPFLELGDLVVDGGNSDFRDAAGRAEWLAGHGVEFVDVGVSGGQWGWQTGYGLMVGSTPGAFERLRLVFEALAAPDGYAHVGDVGAGHLAKAVHNAVQYGLLQAYAEGIVLLKAQPAVDLRAALGAWQGGSSVRSWLLGQMIAALDGTPDLAVVGSEVPDSGMGRWTAQEAIRLAVPTPVLALALHLRFASRDDLTAFRVLSAARGQIGGQKR